MRRVSAILTHLFTFFASAAVWSDPSLALVFGPDHRRVVRTDPGSLFAPLGIVYGMPEVGYVTAFLIDDCYALTVQHAFGTARSAVGRQVVFAAGVRGPAKSWRLSRAVVVADGRLEQAERHEAYGVRRADWAVLRLEKCLGRKFGYARLNPELPRPDEAIGMAGYPIDKPLSDGLVLDPSCHIRGSQAGVLLHDCAALPGNSGSPLFRVGFEGGHESLEVFAMDAAGHSFNGPGADLVRPVTQYYPNYANVALKICPVTRFIDAWSSGCDD
jgi:V8-like Glu-specific endopeptidase